MEEEIGGMLTDLKSFGCQACQKYHADFIYLSNLDITHLTHRFIKFTRPNQL